MRRRTDHILKHRRHRQPALGHFPFDLRQILFGHSERDVNRMNLVDSQQHVIRRFDDVTFVKLQTAGATVNRRADFAIFQIQFVRLHGRRKRIPGRLAGIKLIL